MREAVFWDLAGVTSIGAAGGDMTLAICEKLVGRGREKLAGDGLCGREVLCDLSTGGGML